MTPAPHIFGIRHHGPGSARSLRHALAALQPDILLVEGPPDAAAVLPLLIHPEMQPPVALLVYAEDQPQRAVSYPFAVFSPEWQAIDYALRQNIPVRFMDLPQAHALAFERPPQTPPIDPTPPQPTTAPTDPPPTVDQTTSDPAQTPWVDPIGWLAAAAGYSDGERWWEHMIEQRQNAEQVFTAILEAMTALREIAPPDPDPIEALREAYMRQTIRTAQTEGFNRIAVVCGAWHGPALADLPPPAADAALLQKLPKCKVATTWIPWTHSRLAWSSGYGAGIESPGWYHHLWSAPDQVAVRWMTHVARLLRGQDLDASSAHVIEAVRLAEALAALRDHPRPGLAELNEATRTVLCFGDDLPMQLIHRSLIVGETMGEVPTETPMVPLKRDFELELKRLFPRKDKREGLFDLDLRNPNDRERSHLIHRLLLLGVRWGTQQSVGSSKQGTFHERWQLAWQPELDLALIEAGVWGNTLASAATNLARHQADQAPDLPTLTRLVDHVLLAQLDGAIDYLLDRLAQAAAVANDIGHLMDALPPLVNIVRYGTVRRITTSIVSQVVDELGTRICIGLPLAAAALDDEAAAVMHKQLIAVNQALELLDQPQQLTAWRATIHRLMDQANIHGLIAGSSCRILHQAHIITSDEMAQRLSLALGRANDPKTAANWIEGLLEGSALLLLNDPALLQALDQWLLGLTPDLFTHILPLIRRTFSSFAAAERRRIGELLHHGQVRKTETRFIDPMRAAQVLPLLSQLLGLRPAADQPNPEEVV